MTLPPNHSVTARRPGGYRRTRAEHSTVDKGARYTSSQIEDQISDHGRIVGHSEVGPKRGLEEITMMSSKPTSRPRSCEFGLDLTSGLPVTRPEPGKLKLFQ
jgi:hypothetical protein